MKISVIFTTYNSEVWLEKVLVGFSVQTFKDFEIVVADDGSKESTKQLIEKLRVELGLSVQHVWQPDEGFQKSRILNKAIMAAAGEYLVFTDGDCIPRADFMETHNNSKKEGYFISGGYVKLVKETSHAISNQDIIRQNCFKRNWLISNGESGSKMFGKLIAPKVLSGFFNLITPTSATWNGHNSSGWKKDIIAVNGFNEEMQYGGQDRELGERLMNLGIKPLQKRYSAVCVHLHHERGYVSKESWEKNRAIRKKTRTEKLTKTLFGIEKLA